jgi:hypothetical protein
MSENTSKTAKTFAERAATEPTELHKAFAKWIEEQTGFAPDLKTVQLVTTMRMDFQRSDENQTALKTRKSDAAKKADEVKAKRLAKLEAELAKLKGEAVEQDAAKPVEASKESAKPAVEAPVENASQEASEPEKAAPARRTRRTAKK